MIDTQFEQTAQNNLDRMTAKTIIVKCWSRFFGEVLTSLKPFEIRYNDRNYQPGDWLIQKEYNPETGEYTGSWVAGHVGSVFENVPGLMPGYIAFTFTAIDADKESQPYLWKPESLVQ